MAESRRHWSPVRSILLTAWLPIGLLLPVPSLLLLLGSVTWKGRIAGLAGLGLLLIPILVLRRPLLRRKNLLLSLALAPVLVASIALPLAAPTGVPVAGSSVGSTFPDEPGFRRWSPWNLIPEIDQVGAGISAASMVDPRIDAGDLRRVVLPICRDMEADEGFQRLGSVMNYAYAQFYAEEFDVGHYYWYVPPHAKGERLPTILFLHGSLGNFKVYLWAWKRFADRNRFVVVCPSFGAGMWDLNGGAEAAIRALDRATAALPIDPGRVWLAGLSNGGLGVSRAAALAPERFRGLIYLSAVPEEGVLRSQAYLDGWRGRPVLFIHGDQDNRVPLSAIDDAALRLSTAGVDVTKRVRRGEDHFVFLASLDDMLADIEAWIRSRP